jgi:hypothetical protein
LRVSREQIPGPGERDSDSLKTADEKRDGLIKNLPLVGELFTFSFRSRQE